MSILHACPVLVAFWLEPGEIVEITERTLENQKFKSFQSLAHLVYVFNYVGRPWIRASPAFSLEHAREAGTDCPW